MDVITTNPQDVPIIGPPNPIQVGQDGPLYNGPEELIYQEQTPSNPIE